MQREVYRDHWWPVRDRVCRKAAYKFEDLWLAITMCRKKDLAVQAGGNVGVWPNYLAKYFQTVHTFEPSPENFECLKLNVRDKRVITHNKALYDYTGRIGIKKNPKNCGDDQTVGGGNDVDCIKLDDLNLDPDLIFLDIQGDEIPALAGAIDTIQRCWPIIGLECDPANINKHWDPRKWLERFGYRFVKGPYRDFIGENPLYATAKADGVSLIDGQ